MIEPDFLADTRASYGVFAADYDELVKTIIDDRPLDRAMFAAFAEIVTGPVLEVGSGPGRVTKHLHGLGVDIRGIDLTPEMVALARKLHPGLRFDVGSLTALDVEDGSLGGLVAWYSLIHVPPELHPEVLYGFHRALRPDGHLLLGFQVGDEVKRYTEVFGRPVRLDFHRLSPDRLTSQLHAASFTLEARMDRAAAGNESTPQCFLLARS